MSRRKAVRPCNDDKCSICLEKLNKSKFVYQLPCKHQFHFKCFREWENRSPTCPVCRQTNFFEEYHYPKRYKSSRLFMNERYNRRYWPTLYNRVLSEFRKYVRVCRGENISLREFNTHVLQLCRLYVENQDNYWYYDKDLYYDEKGRCCGILGTSYRRENYHFQV